MLVLVSYDVNTEDAAGRRRLRRIARHCQNWGQRVQFSVFECAVDPAQWKNLRAALAYLAFFVVERLFVYFTRR